jgi:hypothetical protein
MRINVRCLRRKDCQGSSKPTNGKSGGAPHHESRTHEYSRKALHDCLTTHQLDIQSIQHVGRPGHLAHAQVYPQPSPRPQADGRVRIALPTQAMMHLRKDQALILLPVIVMSSTLPAPTSPRMSSARSSASSTRHQRTRCPSSDSALSLVVARAQVSHSSTIHPRR